MMLVVDTTGRMLHPHQAGRISRQTVNPLEGGTRETHGLVVWADVGLG